MSEVHLISTVSSLKKYLRCVNRSDADNITRIVRDMEIARPASEVTVECHFTFVVKSKYGGKEEP